MLAKRTSIEIIAEILQTEGRKKTAIMYATALTYPQTVRYLAELTERGLMRRQEDPSGSDVYSVTQKGRDLRVHLDAVMHYLGLGEAEVAALH